MSKMDLFNPEGKGERIPFFPVVSAKNGRSYESYDYRAILGSQRYHLGSGTRTDRSFRIRDFKMKGEVEICPGDSAELNVKDGDMVKILSPCGVIKREIKINMGLSPGIVFIPTAFNNNDAMQLIEWPKTGESDSPSLKECHVKIEKQG